jgi:hypothetical protein
MIQKMGIASGLSSGANTSAMTWEWFDCLDMGRGDLRTLLPLLLLLCLAIHLLPPLPPSKYHYHHSTSWSQLPGGVGRLLLRGQTSEGQDNLGGRLHRTAGDRRGASICRKWRTSTWRSRPALPKWKQWRLTSTSPWRISGDGCTQAIPDYGFDCYRVWVTGRNFPITRWPPDFLSRELCIHFNIYICMCMFVSTCVFKYVDIYCMEECMYIYVFHKN